MNQWKLIDEHIGYTDRMVAFRNSLAQRMNALQAVPAQANAQDGESPDPGGDAPVLEPGTLSETDQRRIHADMLLEVLDPEPDFDAARMLLVQCALDEDTMGAEIGGTLLRAQGPYRTAVERNDIPVILRFLEMLPEATARTEWLKVLTGTLAAGQHEQALQLWTLLRHERFGKWRTDTAVEHLLGGAYVRAVQENHLPYGECLAEYIGFDADDINRRALHAVAARERGQAPSLLRQATRPALLRQPVTAWYWDVIHAGSRNPVDMQYAFDLALAAGLTGGDDREFAEFPAGKLFEQALLRSDTPDFHSERMQELSRWCPPAVKQHVLAQLCLARFNAGACDEVRSLKTIFALTFPTHGYPGEQIVRERFRALMRSADNAEGNSAEDLKKALELARLFDFDDGERLKLRRRLFRFYLDKGMTDEAVDWFLSTDDPMVTLVWERIDALLKTNEISQAMRLLERLPCKAPDEMRDRCRKACRAMAALPSNPTEVLLYEAANCALMKIRALPSKCYRQLIAGCFSLPEPPLQTLEALAPSVGAQLDAAGRVLLQRHIRKLSRQHNAMTDRLKIAYAGTLPPSIRDRLVYVIRRLFKMI